MSRWSVLVCCLLSSLLPAVTLAVSPGTDVLVPAAVRGVGLAGSTWVTDVYILNPGNDSTAVAVSWLVRNQPNHRPESRQFLVGGGETLVLEDVVLQSFGLESAKGALLVSSEREVVVSSRVYNNRQGVTFGQGLEGVPARQATRAGDSTDVVGLTHNSSFRTNLIAVGIVPGARIALSLRDPAGNELASGHLELGAFEPRLFPVTDLDPSLQFDHATLHAEVQFGSAVILASKVDNDPATGDPTTLEAWTPIGPPSVNGWYYVALFDGSGRAAGGTFVVIRKEVTELAVTYLNLEKGDPSDPDCPRVFAMRPDLGEAVPLTALAEGFSFSQSYPEGGTLAYTMTLEIQDSLWVTGAVAAQGSGFTDGAAGCNGSFPTLLLRGGRSN